MKPKFYLPIDSENPDFQFIHIDVLQKFAVACKFNFNADKTKFDITHAKIIRATTLGPDFMSFKSLSNTTSVTDLTKEYAWQMTIDLTPDVRDPDDPVNFSKGNDFNIKRTGAPKREHLIDLCIPNLSFFIDLYEWLSSEDSDKKRPITADFGTHFCKFYIV